jgi:hypothetical protein
LGNEKRQISLLVKRGDSDGNDLERMQITVLPGVAKAMPSNRLKG